MLRKLLLSVALVVCVSSPGLADIDQFQGFGIGLNSAINLLSGQQTADNIQALTVSLGQMTTQPSGLSAFQGGIPFGQPIQLGTTGIALDGQALTVGLMQNDAINTVRLSLLNSLPGLMLIR